MYHLQTRFKVFEFTYLWHAREGPCPSDYTVISIMVLKQSKYIVKSMSNPNSGKYLTDQICH